MQSSGRLAVGANSLSITRPAVPFVILILTIPAIATLTLLALCPDGADGRTEQQLPVVPDRIG